MNTITKTASRFGKRKERCQVVFIAREINLPNEFSRKQLKISLERGDRSMESSTRIWSMFPSRVEETLTMNITMFYGREEEVESKTLLVNIFNTRPFSKIKQFELDLSAYMCYKWDLDYLHFVRLEEGGDGVWLEGSLGVFPSDLIPESNQDDLTEDELLEDEDDEEGTISSSTNSSLSSTLGSLSSIPKLVSRGQVEGVSEERRDVVVVQSPFHSSLQPTKPTTTKKKKKKKKKKHKKEKWKDDDDDVKSERNEITTSTPLPSSPPSDPIPSSTSFLTYYKKKSQEEEEEEEESLLNHPTPTSRYSQNSSNDDDDRRLHTTLSSSSKLYSMTPLKPQSSFTKTTKSTSQPSSSNTTSGNNSITNSNNNNISQLQAQNVDLMDQISMVKEGVFEVFQHLSHLPSSLNMKNRGMETRLPRFDKLDKLSNQFESLFSEPIFQLFDSNHQGRMDPSSYRFYDSVNMSPTSRNHQNRSISDILGLREEEGRVEGINPTVSIQTISKAIGIIKTHIKILLPALYNLSFDEEKEIDGLRALNEDLRSEVESQRLSILHTQQLLDGANKSLEITDKKLSEVMLREDDLVDEISSKREYYEQMDVKHKEIKRTHSKMQKTVVTLLHRIQNLLEEKERVLGENGELIEENEGLDGEICSLQEKCEDLERVKSQSISQLTSQVETFEKQNEELSQGLDYWKQRCLDCEEENKKLTSENEELPTLRRNCLDFGEERDYYKKEFYRFTSTVKRTRGILDQKIEKMNETSKELFEMRGELLENSLDEGLLRDHYQILEAQIESLQFNTSCYTIGITSTCRKSSVSNLDSMILHHQPQNQHDTDSNKINEDEDNEDMRLEEGGGESEDGNDSQEDDSKSVAFSQFEEMIDLEDHIELNQIMSDLIHQKEQSEVTQSKLREQISYQKSSLESLTKERDEFVDNVRDELDEKDRMYRRERSLLNQTKSHLSETEQHLQDTKVESMGLARRVEELSAENTNLALESHKLKRDEKKLREMEELMEEMVTREVQLKRQLRDMVASFHSCYDLI